MLNVSPVFAQKIMRLILLDAISLKVLAQALGPQCLSLEYLLCMLRLERFSELIPLPAKLGARPSIQFPS